MTPSPGSDPDGLLSTRLGQQCAQPQYEDIADSRPVDRCGCQPRNLSFGFGRVAVGATIRSVATTRCPSATSLRTACDPTSPKPPVTRTFSAIFPCVRFIGGSPASYEYDILLKRE
jgi:hypothetical protein